MDGLPVLGDLTLLDDLRSRGIQAAIVAIGDNRERMRIADLLEQQGFTLISAIHPSACIAPSATLGKHLIIGSRVTVCVHASIEEHCVLLAGAIVEHDNKLGVGAFLHSAVRLAGGVKIGAGATLHIGACVIPYRKVGRDANVEPGSVVIADVLPGSVVGGAPAIRLDHERSHFVPDDRNDTTIPKAAADSGRLTLANQPTK